MSYENFFQYARARQAIKLARDAGKPGPWTQDSILQEFRFCNVFREDDKVTTWFRENLRAPLSANSDIAHVLWATIVFRWFNRIPTGRILAQCGLLEGKLDYALAKRRLLKEMPSGPWVTGAYMVKTPPGMNKIDGLFWCMRQIEPHIGCLASCLQANGRLELATDSLSQFPYLGSFMAYEIVTDLRHTPVLSHAGDIMTWASPGPGAARGAGRVFNNDHETYRYTQPSDRAEVILHMQELLALSKTPRLWPHPQAWEMRDVEHTLCEFDKYERARLGEGRPKQLFKPDCAQQPSAGK